MASILWLLNPCVMIGAVVRIAPLYICTSSPLKLEICINEASGIFLKINMITSSRSSFCTHRNGFEKQLSTARIRRQNEQVFAWLLWVHSIRILFEILDHCRRLRREQGLHMTYKFLRTFPAWLSSVYSCSHLELRSPPYILYIDNWTRMQLAPSTVEE